mmetsp:Transcript_97190/g.216843  ORF Transcript_97190/g.216843 Transcript_97190/m.216843 type:complete len:323 (+) Transcript_97190:112-1080(+)
MAMLHPASESLVEAYFGGGADLWGAGAVAAVGAARLAPRAPPGRRSQAQKQTFSARAVAATAPRAPVRGASPSRPTTTHLLEGTWAPPPSTASKFLQAQLQEAKRVSRELDGLARGPEVEILGRLARKGRPPAGSIPGASVGAPPRTGPSGSSSAWEGSSADGASSAGGRGDGTARGSRGYALSEGSCSLSHATTPSWRSRSFPPRYKATAGNLAAAPSTARGPISSVGEEASDLAADAKRLPQLPMEARWAAMDLRRHGGAPSELRRLEDCRSSVNEANAMLVESFLNVKRHPPSEIAATSDGGASEVGGGGSIVPPESWC